MDFSCNSINILGLRLEKTLQYFNVFKNLNELANIHTDEELYKKLEESALFWQAVRSSLLESIFVGIFSLLDKKDQNSHTFYTEIDRIKKIKQEYLPTLDEFITDLDLIKERYKNYRNKLIGHNVKNILKYHALFDEEKFTITEMTKNFDKFDYIFKTLFYMPDNAIAITADNYKQYRLRHNFTGNKAIDDTHKLLRLIKESIILK